MMRSRIIVKFILILGQSSINQSPDQVNIKNFNYSSCSNSIPIKKSVIKTCNSKKYINNNLFGTLVDKPLNQSKIISSGVSSNAESETALAIFMKEIISLDLKLESFKEALSLKPDARFKEIFSIFDKNSTGYVSAYEMKEILLLNMDIYSNIDDIKLLFKRYDKDRDSKLNYPEFIEMILPKKEEYAELIKRRKDISGKAISNESKLILVKVLKALLEVEILVENSRRVLENKSFNEVYLFIK